MRVNNMGAVTKKQVEEFAQVVLEKDFPSWKMLWTTAGSICMQKSKTILIDVSFINKYPWQAKEIVLHECSHINTTDRFHSDEFYKEYIRLLTKFML